MTKESKKQIKAQLINEVSAQYHYKMARLENQIKYMENRLAQQHQETLEYRQRALKAEEELEKYLNEEIIKSAEKEGLKEYEIAECVKRKSEKSC